MEDTAASHAAEPERTFHRKPLLNVEQQITHLKARGVRFNLCSEADATEYLTRANNYARAASYRKLFPVHTQGAGTGTYINLDFAYLIELSSIDRELRELLLSIALDVEHFAKMRLLARTERKGEDGYAIVEGFLALRPRVKQGLQARAEAGERHDTYSGDLIARYIDDMPVWALLEVIDFGTFVDFWLFCAERWTDEQMRQVHYVLKSVKALRNAAAHNSLIVRNLNAKDAPTFFPTSALISDFLNTHGLKNNRTRRNKLKNLRIAQIAAAFWALDKFCDWDTTKKRHVSALAELKAFISKKSLAQEPSAGTNVAILSFFEFIWRLAGTWFPGLLSYSHM